MNVLSRDKQIEIIAALTEGMSIRATERLTGIHRDTIMRFGARLGMGCAELHDRAVVGLQVGRIEIDELWAYVGKKQRRVTKQDGADVGDQYTFTALASSARAIIAYHTGKRDNFSAQEFMRDLSERVLGRPEISSDGFSPYGPAIRAAFGQRASHGQIVKTYSVVDLRKDAAHRYSPAQVVAVSREIVTGLPTHISTSLVERSNLSIRMASRRFTRLTNGFSKKLENHAAAVALFVAHYNFCRVHEALRTTPAMALGLADHPWSIGELIDAALGMAPTDKHRKRRFKVIEGGLS